MSRPSFEYLLDKYLAGTSTPDERRLVEQWYDLAGQDPEQVTSTADWPTLKEQLWQRIRRQAISGSPLWRYRWWLLGALVMGVLSAVAVVYLTQHKPVPLPFDAETANMPIAKATTPEGTRQLLLADGTEVTLMAGARLTYPEQFGVGRREVMLEGAAFFDVAKDVRRPFLVHTRYAVAKVLGTRFQVVARPDGVMEVAVKTGKVAVSARQSAEGRTVVLTPNQTVVYQAETQHFATRLSAEPEPVTPEKGEPEQPPVSFRFDKTPLSEVLNALKQTYGIDIAVENDRLGACNFTGDLSGQAFYTRLDFLCKAIGARYQIDGLTIRLSGHGCN
jgi:transmembrane sensor